MKLKLLNCLCFLIFISSPSFSQIEVAKLIGKNSNEYSVGFGAFVNVGYPVSDASSVTAEVNFLFFSVKDYDGDGIALIPVKLGYRYTFNGTGSGLYAQAQAGYNFWGANSYNGTELPFKGPVFGAGFGYLFETEGWLKPDIGIRFETLRYDKGSASYIALRFSQSFSFGRRE
jgi:hypothetical protein